MSEVFKTVLSMSIGASVLAVLVLIARAIIGRRQTLVVTILFAMLIAKLIVPLSIESNASILNILPTPFAQTTQVEEFVPSVVDEAAELSQPGEADEAQALLQPGNMTGQMTESADGDAETQPVPLVANDTMPSSAAVNREPMTPMGIAAIVWLFGMVVMAAIIAASNIAFMRKVRKNRAYDAPGFDDMVRQCAKEFGIRQKIRAVRMSDVNTVAVCGIFRPKLLIAPETFEALGRDEQRHVIMHELSHIKRKDTLVCLIITMVNVLHWFNPFVWIAFAIFRKDLEVMCDAKVLRKMAMGERRGYANTLVTLAQKAGKRSSHLAMALFMSKASMKRRIAMIAKYKRNKPLIVALALILAIGVAITGCTTSVSDAKIGEREVVEIGELVLIATYTMDFSEYADDEARMHNIKKAASKLNGVRIVPYEQISFIEIIGSVTGENGWKKAPGFTMESVMQMAGVSDWDNALAILSDPQIEQMGGGMGLIETAFMRVGDDANLSGGAGGDFEGLITEADSDLRNWFDADVIFETLIEANTVTVNLYGKVYSSEQLEQLHLELQRREEEEADNNGSVTSTVTAYRLGTGSVDFSFCADDKNILLNIVKTMGILEGKVFSPGKQEMLFEKELYAEDGWETAQARSWADIGGLEPGNIRHIEYLDTELQRGGGSEIVLAAVKGAAIEAGLSVTTLDPGEAILNENLTDVMLSIILRGNSIYAVFYAEEPIETLAPIETPFEDEELEFVPQITYNGDIGPEHLSVDEAKSLAIEYCELLYDITLEKPLISASFNLPDRDNDRATWFVFTEKIGFRLDAITGSIIFYHNSSFNTYVEKDPMPLVRSILADEDYYTKAEDVVVRIMGNSGKVEDMFIDGIQEVYNGNESVSYSVDVWVIMETGPCYIVSFVGDAKRVSRIASFATKQDMFVGNDIG